MKKLLFFVVFPLVAGAKGAAQPTEPSVVQSGSTARETTDPVTSPLQERVVPDFTSINVTDGIKLYLRPGTQEQVTVQTSAASLSDKIKTVVEGGTLRVYFDASADPTWKGLVNSTEEFKVYVTVNNLQAIQAAKGAQVSLQSAFTLSENLTIGLVSGAALVGQLTARELTVTMRGGSVARVAGSVTQLHVQVKEGSQFQSPELKAEDCIAYASSASRIKVFVKKTLEANSVNEAVISYGGNAELKKQSSELGGKILHI